MHPSALVLKRRWAGGSLRAHQRTGLQQLFDFRSIDSYLFEDFGGLLADTRG